MDPFGDPSDDVLLNLQDTVDITLSDEDLLKSVECLERDKQIYCMIVQEITMDDQELMDAINRQLPKLCLGFAKFGKFGSDSLSDQDDTTSQKSKFRKTSNGSMQDLCAAGLGFDSMMGNF